VLKRDFLTVEVYGRGFLLGVFKISTKKLGGWIAHNGFFLTKNNKEFAPVPIAMWEVIGTPEKDERQMALLNI